MKVVSIHYKIICFQGQITRMLRCFCGCSEITEDEIKIINEMSGMAFLQSERAKTLFINFMKTRGVQKCPALDMLRCSEYCKLILNDYRREGTDQNFKLLYRVVPRFKWIKTLKQQREDEVAVVTSLYELVEECYIELETQREFAEFKEELLAKLPPRNE